MAVRAGRPSSGSGGLEAYAIPIFGLMIMGWIVRRLGPLLAARISRLLVGEETPLDFANTGKLKGKGKRATKATPASAPLRSPPAKRPNGGSTTSGAALSVAQAEVAPRPAPAKSTGSASYQDLALAEAPLTATQDDEAMATAKAREASVEWTVHEKKRSSLPQADPSAQQGPGTGLATGFTTAASPWRPRLRGPPVPCLLAGQRTVRRRAPLPRGATSSPSPRHLPSVLL